MTTINIEYDDRQVQRAMQRLINSGSDMSPLMRRLAAHLQASTEEAFDNQTAPDGKPWAKLRPSTIKQRQRAGHVPIEILRRSGDLKRSIIAQHGKDFAEASTNFKYATTHQFGASKGAFGKTKRGAPIPWGDIPARPFLGVSARIEIVIKDEVLNFIGKQWR